MIKNILVYISKIITLLVIIIFSGSLFLSFLSTVVSPENNIWLVYFGLSAPVLILANIIIALILIIRLKPIAIVSILALLLNIGNIGNIFQLSVKKHYEHESPTTKIMSYNVRMFTNNDGYLVADSVISNIISVNPDIVCIQEFLINSKNSEELINDMLKPFPYSKFCYLDVYKERKYGTAILSKYPIIKSGHSLFADSLAVTQWVDLLINNDTVRIFNNHMSSNKIYKEDKTFIENSISGSIPSGMNIERIERIVSKFKNGCEQRATQADSVHIIIKKSPYPVIVCGDFNDTPISYTYQKMSEGLKDAFCQKGKGYGYSYRELFKLLRIDYIFVSNQFEVITYDSPDFEYSDHNPVVVEITKN